MKDRLRERPCPFLPNPPTGAFGRGFSCWAPLGWVSLASVALVAASEPIRVNCGGDAFVDPCGRSWKADLGFRGGAIEIAQVPIAGTGMPALYQSGRWAEAALEYSIPFGEKLPGEVAVVLHFAEIFPGGCAAGQRVFEIWIEGTCVSGGFDIVREGGCQTALARTFLVRPEGVTIEIALIPLKGPPKISGIEVYADPTAVEGCAPCPSELSCEVRPGPSVRLTWRNRSPAGSSIVIVRDGVPIGETRPESREYLDASVSPGLHVYRLRVPGLPGGACESEPCAVLVGPPYRVNCGGDAWKDPRGNAWWPETGIDQGLAYTAKDLGIFGTDSELLFRSQRIGSADGTPLGFSFWVPEGIWRVTLHLAEVFAAVDEIGERTFDVRIAGAQAADAVDIIARAGFATATSLCWDARVAAGPLEIELAGREGVPAVAALEIAASPSPVPSLLGLVASLDPAGSASFAWDPFPLPADRVRVERDGSPIAEIPGTATSWTDPAVPDGAHEYAFAPLRAHGEACPRRTALELPPLRVNCGGYGFLAADGILWGPDRGFQGGERKRVDPPPPILTASDPRLYAVWRRGTKADPSIRYALPAVRGRLYRVTLHFADLEPSHAGAAFAVRVNGATVREAFDVASTFGPRAAGAIALDVSSPSGEIAIALEPAGGPPMISAIEVLPADGFLRGDVSGDGLLAIDDPIALLMHIFADGPLPACPDAADADDDGAFTIGDAIGLLNYLFAGGPPPASPAAVRCGPDPTPDDLPPCRYRSCPPGVVETRR